VHLDSQSEKGRVKQIVAMGESTFLVSRGSEVKVWSLIANNEQLKGSEKDKAARAKQWAIVATLSYQNRQVLEVHVDKRLKLDQAGIAKEKLTAILFTNG